MIEPSTRAHGPSEASLASAAGPRELLLEAPPDAVEVLALPAILLQKLLSVDEHCR
jgi:hypothetical protein